MTYIYYYQRVLLFLFIFLSFMLPQSILNADSSPIDISDQPQINILLHSSIYISDKDLNATEIMQLKTFTPYLQDQFSRGFTKEFIYFRFTLRNRTDAVIRRLFVETSPVLEHLYLYSKTQPEHVESRGMKHLNKEHRYISYSIPLEIPPHSTQNYYVKVHSGANPLEFKLLLEQKDHFLDKQLGTLAFNLILLGMIIAFMFYSFALSFYTRDKSYLFYALYLALLTEQQATQLGISQIYIPWWVEELSLRVNIINIALLSLAAIFFAISFLKTENTPRIHKGYLFFAILYVLQILFLPGDDIGSLNIIVITGAIFIFYNLGSGIYIYNQGYKQARLFVLGFGIVAVLFMIVILDSLGITTLMHGMYNALLVGTVLEAFILLLAFADRYLILQKEKEAHEKQKLIVAQQQAHVIEQEVIRKTKELKKALDIKNVLIDEIHHRVKNNLNIILSIVQLQSSEMDDPILLQKMTELEHRISAIAKTYSMLLESDNQEQINMEPYIQKLISDISTSYNTVHRKVIFHTDIKATLPIKESSYIGLIINEIITNAYKHAFTEKIGKITISMQSRKAEDHTEYLLTVEDDGIGFEKKASEEKLGLKLIYTLIEEQLKGEVKLQTKPHTRYEIRFFSGTKCA